MMEKDVMQTPVWVFKTNISNKKDLITIEGVLNIASIHQWSIDQQDCDCVLRVVTPVLSPAEIILKITGQGYTCSELTD